MKKKGMLIKSYKLKSQHEVLNITMHKNDHFFKVEKSIITQCQIDSKDRHHSSLSLLLDTLRFWVVNMCS